MKKRSSRLRPVERLAEDKAKTATLDMVSARDLHQNQKVKLNELLSYRLEYLEQFQSRAKNGMQSTQVQQYQHFISQLDVAIQQQQLVVKQSAVILDERQSHWRDKDSHKRAINKVVRRFQKQEFDADEDTEQGDLDEHNTQQYNQKHRRQ